MKLGLTGGIGCGKSSVVRIFQSLGWRTVQSDLIVRDLLAEDAGVIEAVREHWGEAVFTKAGQIDRKALAYSVFEDGAQLAALEGLLHPRVREVWTRQLRESPDAAWLVEIPLLFEKSLESQFDCVVCVHSPEWIVDQRMSERGYSAEDVQQRRRRQMPTSEKIHRSDYALTNAGTLEFLEKQTKRLSQQLHRQCG